MRSTRNNRRACGLLLSALCLITPSAEAKGDVSEVCARFAGLDLDLDGSPELEALELLELLESPAGTPRVVVLVERRLLEDSAERAPLRAAFSRLASDLRSEGFAPALIEAQLYRGPRHQDGLSLLALRRVFKALAARPGPGDAHPLAGALLIGSFPEAFLVRQVNWRRKIPLTLRAKRKNERRFERPIPILRSVPEAIAKRSELVLCDLDGRWEERYFLRRQRLSSVIAVYPDGVPPRGGPCEDFERGSKPFEDFFYVNDGLLEESELLDQKGRVTGLSLRPVPLSDQECSKADLARPNRIARPDIIVSRINPRGVALRPRRELPGVTTQSLLDARGKPRAVPLAKGARAPRDEALWERDPALERRLLIAYLDRNHAYRQGRYRSAFKPAAIGKDLKGGFAAVRRARPDWSGFAEPGYDGGEQADLAGLALWLKKPAAMRDIRAHTSPRSSVFGASTDAELRAAIGGPPWAWVARAGRLVPSLAAFAKRGKATFHLYRSLWEASSQPEHGSLILHTGCDVISPANAARRPYDHPSYGFQQGGESLLFYAGGLALCGRAKVFYDTPKGFYAALADGARIGEAWRGYFERESKASKWSSVGGDIGRKRSYFWSVIGDWTLKLAPRQPRGGAW